MKTKFTITAKPLTWQGDTESKPDEVLQSYWDNDWIRSFVSREEAERVAFGEGRVKLDDGTSVGTMGLNPRFYEVIEQTVGAVDPTNIH